MSYPPQPVRRETILCVDDERPILSALRRLLRRAGYPVLLANSGAEALEMLTESNPEQGAIGLVISDMRMPWMSGAELLQQIAERWPQVQRILLTGQADVESSIAAVNLGRIYRYLTKPWDDAELLSVVEAALGERQQQCLERQTSESLREHNQMLQQNMREQAQQLVQARHYESLTGLPNRNLLLQRLEAAIEAQRITDEGEGGDRLALLAIGLDRFQRVNESLGYEGGDELIKLVAKRITAAVYDADLVAHLGGDRFCVMIGGIHAEDEAALLGKLLQQQFNQAYQLRGQEVFVSASIGIELFPGSAVDAENLLRNAEAAQRQTKRSGGNGWCFYDAAMNRRSADNLLLESELRRALEQGEFRLHYQPRVSVSRGRCVAAEALLRWQHPERGLVSPGEFIPVLEETGLIEGVGAWVIEEACAMLARLQTRGWGRLPIAVNLSARQFASGDLLGVIERACLRQGLRLQDGLLELEITENLLMQDSQHAEQALRGLDGAGLCIAIDDFGTGYSSLSYLTRFPVRCVKIDRSFVIEIEHDPAALAIVRAIVSMTEALGLQLICEGVEEMAQLEALRGLGCDEFQGFLFSCPLAEADFFAWLAAGPAAEDETTASGGGGAS